MRRTLITLAALSALAIGAAEARAADHTVTIDATALTNTTFKVDGTSYNTSSAVTLSLSEGSHNVADFGWAFFTVETDGTVSYDAGYEDFLSGAGTSALTVDGFELEIDVRSLSDTTNYFRNYHLVSATAVDTVTVMPRLVTAAPPEYIATSGGRVSFWADGDGAVRYDSAHEGFLSGDGTNRLTVDGFEIHIDLSDLSHTSYGTNLPMTLSHTSLNSVTVIPQTLAIFGDFWIGGPGTRVGFRMDLNGDIVYLAEYEDFLSGAGTDTLTVDGCELTIDARSADATTFSWSGLSGNYSTSNTHNFTVLPTLGTFDKYWLKLGGDTVFHDFLVDPDCDVDYAASEEDFYSGRGTSTLVVGLRYVFCGVLQPINPDGSSIFKAGRTVPVKFQLKDQDGVIVGDAIALLSAVRITDVILGTVEEVDVDAAGNADTGIAFRYDATDQQYIFNLSTKNWGAGTYRLDIALDDGTTHSVNFSLRR